MERGILAPGLLDEEGQENNDTNEDTVIEPTDINDVKRLRGRVMQVAIGDGTDIFELIHTMIPLVNSVYGRGNCLQRMVKNSLSKYLPDGFNGSRITKLSKERKASLLSALASACSAKSGLEAVKMDILAPFEKAIAEADGGEAGERLRLNTELNRLGLLAWMLVYGPATELLEKLTSKIEEENKPAFIEQTGGPAGYRLDIYDKLLSISEGMKDDRDAFDLSLFAEDRIGEEASMACSKVDPLAGSFKDAKALKDAHTNLLNRHTRVLNRANASGTGPAIGTPERISIAYDRCGEPGKTKDIAAFYAFVIFDNFSHRNGNGDISWTVRDFSSSIGRSSSNPETVDLTNTGLSKKESARIAAIVKAVNVHGTPTSTSPQTSDAQSKSDKEFHQARMELYHVRKQSESFQMWRGLADSSLYATCSKRRKIEVEEHMFQLARASCSAMNLGIAHGAMQDNDNPDDDETED